MSNIRKVLIITLIILPILLFSGGYKEKDSIKLDIALDIFKGFEILDKDELFTYLESVKSKIEAIENPIEKEVLSFMYHVELAKYAYFYLDDKENARPIIKSLDKQFIQISKHSKDKRIENKELICRYIDLYFLVGMLSGQKNPWIMSNDFMIAKDRALRSKDNAILTYAKLDYAIFNVSFTGFSGGAPALGLKSLQSMENDETLQDLEQLQLLVKIFIAYQYQSMFRPVDALRYINMALEIYPDMLFLKNMKERLFVGDYSFQ